LLKAPFVLAGHGLLPQVFSIADSDAARNQPALEVPR